MRILLRELQPGQPGPGTSWFVVSSNFHVSLRGGDHPLGFPRELVVMLAQGLVDQVLEGDNDLVVDTASMSAIGLPAGGFIADTLAFGTNDVVHHANDVVQDPRAVRLGGRLTPDVAVPTEIGAPEPAGRRAST